MVAVSTGTRKRLSVVFNYLSSVMMVASMLVLIVIMFYGSWLPNRLLVTEVISVVCGVFSELGCCGVVGLML